MCIPLRPPPPTRPSRSRQPAPPRSCAGWQAQRFHLAGVRRLELRFPRPQPLPHHRLRAQHDPRARPDYHFANVDNISWRSVRERRSTTGPPVRVPLG
eukprot:gene9628-biopygen10752